MKNWEQPRDKVTAGGVGDQVYKTITSKVMTASEPKLNVETNSTHSWNSVWFVCDGSNNNDHWMDVYLLDCEMEIQNKEEVVKLYVRYTHSKLCLKYFEWHKCNSS